MISAANKVPSVLTPEVLEKNLQANEDDESIQCQSSQAELCIMKKIDLLGTADLNSTDQQEAYNLICEYTCNFSQNNLESRNINH